MLELLDINTIIDSWQDVAMLGVIGLGLGVVSGLFGVGAGFLSTPLLQLIFGIPYPLAIGSSLSYIVGTAAAGTVSHRRRGNVHFKAAGLIAIGSLGGVLIGDQILQLIHRAFGSHATQVMHGIYIVLLGTIAWRVAVGQVHEERGDGFIKRLPIGPRVDLGPGRLSGLSVPGLAGVGLLGGILSGALGIGGGVLVVPLLILAVGMTAHQAVGTSLAMTVVAAAVGVVKKGWDGQVDLGIAMSLLVGSAVGAQIGAGLCHRLNARHLQRYFAALVLLVAVSVAAKLISELTGG